MATTAIGQTTTTDPAAASIAASSAAGDRGMGSMSSQDFFKLLVTELKQQDPLQPAKTADMISEVSQIRSIELSKQLTDALGNLTRTQHTAGASELIGKYVTARLKDDAGNQQDVSGIVTGVRFESDGTAVLELDTGQSIPADSVTRIQSAAAAPANRGGVSGGTGNTVSAGNAVAANSAGSANSGTATNTTNATAATPATTTQANKTNQNAKGLSFSSALPFLQLNGACGL